MKFFKKSILALMAIAATAALTACSDDNDVKYAEGQQSPGAYFPVTNPATVELTEGANTVSIPVCRTSVEAPTAYTLTITDESGLFQGPGEVVFPTDATSANILLTYDPTQIETGKNYPVTFTISTGTEYGNATYKVNFVQKDPVVTVPAGEGTGTFIYNGCYSGADSGLKVYYSYNPKTPNYRTYTVEEWGGGVNFKIVMPDATAIDEDGCIPVRVGLQLVGAAASNGQPLYVCDTYFFYNDLLGKPAQAAQYAGASYYNTKTGLFSLHLVEWYFTDPDAGNLSYFGENYEYLQLDGFPDYSVSASYMGYMTDPDENQKAVITVAAGADAEEVKAFVMKTDEPDEVLNAILTGADGVQDATPGETQQLQFDIAGAGTYTYMAVTFAGGKAMEIAADQFEVTGAGSSANDWADAGMADMCDGWIYAVYARSGVPIVVADEPFPVKIQKHKTEANMWRMVKPWGDNCPVASLNEGGKPKDVNFFYDNKYFYIEPQNSGFVIDADKGTMYVGTFEGMLMAGIEGIDIESVINYLNEKNPEAIAQIEDGVVTIPIPLFGYDAADEFGYSWENVQASIIYMPDASEAAKAKAKAARVAKPRINGLSASFKAVKAVKKQRMPREFNMNNTRKPALLRK